jgi:hypothetical protein
MDLLKKITDFFQFEDSPEQPLKYRSKLNNQNEIMTLNENELSRLANKIQNEDLKIKINEIIKTNTDLRQHINNILDNEILDNESQKSLEKMYLELLQAEIRIILRDIKVIIEEEKAMPLDVKNLFDVLTKKFNVINNYLEKENSAPENTKPNISSSRPPGGKKETGQPPGGKKDTGQPPGGKKIHENKPAMVEPSNIPDINKKPTESIEITTETEPVLELPSVPKNEPELELPSVPKNEPELELPSVPKNEPGISERESQKIAVPIEITGGASKNIRLYNKTINYCKYIKYKIKYENLKYNILYGGY